MDLEKDKDRENSIKNVHVSHIIWRYASHIIRAHSQIQTRARGCSFEIHSRKNPHRNDDNDDEDDDDDDTHTNQPTKQPTDDTLNACTFMIGGCT